MKTAAKLLTLLLFCVSILFLSSQSQASSPAKPEASSRTKPEASKEKWKYYASDEEDVGYFYNVNDIQYLKGNLVRVWVQAIYSVKNLKYSDAKFQWEIDCTKRRMRGLKANAKKKDGTTTTIKESSDWSDIPAESTAETLYGIVCKKKDVKTP